MTVNVPETRPLSIMTVAYEKDGCPDFNFPDDIHEKIVKAIAPLLDFGNSPQDSGNPLLDFDSNHPVEKYPGLRVIQAGLNNQINSKCVQLNDRHEILGHINRIYQPTSFGAGYHTYPAIAKYRDFDLTYHIEVTAAPPNSIEK